MKTKRASGPSQSYAARVEAGREMLSTWLSAEATADLATLCERWKCTKRQAIERSLENSRKSTR